MDGYGQNDQNTHMLHRIVALLFALADLAEGVSLRRPAIRQPVLWILYPAEAVARGLVVEAYGPVPLPAPRSSHGEDGPAEALRLAAPGASRIATGPPPRPTDRALIAPSSTNGKSLPNPPADPDRGPARCCHLLTCKCLSKTFNYLFLFDNFSSCN